MDRAGLVTDLPPLHNPRGGAPLPLPLPPGEPWPSACSGECLDVSFVTGNQDIIEVHLRIWQLFRIVSEQITEWKCLAFFKVKGWRREGASRASPQGHLWWATLGTGQKVVGGESGLGFPGSSWLGSCEKQDAGLEGGVAGLTLGLCPPPGSPADCGPY